MAPQVRNLWRMPPLAAASLVTAWICLVASQAGGADLDGFRNAEKRTLGIADRVLAATVVLGAKNGVAGSGVIVSEDGLILTVAHVAGEPGTEFMVVLSDGRRVRAKSLGCDYTRDIAAMKIVSGGKWPFVEIGRSVGLKRGQWLLAAGHPGGLKPGRRPLLRLGRLLAVGKGENMTDGILTDTTISVGDSGGPLFDLDGKVIGILSNIDVGGNSPLMKNRACPIDVFRRRRLDFLHGTQFGEPLTGIAVPSSEKEENSARDELKKGKRFAKSNRKLLDCLTAVAARSGKGIAVVYCGGKMVALGAVVRKDGYLLTKASELKGWITCRVGNREFPALVVNRDEEHDLALLHIAVNDLVPVEWATDDEPRVGTWLLTPDAGGRPLALGILSHASREIVRRFNRAVLGVGFDPETPTVRSVHPESPAQKAGLQVDDVIVAIDGHPTPNRKAIRARMVQYEPGAKIDIRVQRGSAKVQLAATLVSPEKLPTLATPNMTDVISQMSGGVSYRREGFPIAFTHDTVLAPQQCGGPTLNLNGQGVGLNIARASRCESYALSAGTVRRLAARLLAEAKTP